MTCMWRPPTFRSAPPTTWPPGKFSATGDLDAIKQHDAILLGAVGGDPRDERLKGVSIERDLLLKLRFDLDHYVNLRPTTLFPGVASPLANPGAVDFVVVREGTEGMYVGNGGSLRKDTPNEIATEVSVNTAYGVERVVRFAFAARRIPAGEEAHPRAQDQRAGQRRLALAAHRRPGLGRIPRHRRRLPARGRRDDLHGDEPQPVRRHRHRQPVRRHPHRPRRGHQRRNRPRRIREHQPGRRLPEHVRAGARIRARHRRASRSPTRPPRCSRSRCSSTISACRMPPPASPGSSPTIWRAAAPPHAPPRKSVTTSWPRCKNESTRATMSTSDN